MSDEADIVTTITLFDLLSHRIAQKRCRLDGEPTEIDMMTARHILREFYGDADYMPTLPITIHWKGYGKLNGDICWWMGYLTHDAPISQGVCNVIFKQPVDGVVMLAWIGVKEQFQRMGIATQALDRIRSITKATIDFGATTTDGEALQRTYEARL